jgi:hypothetical protein
MTILFVRGTSYKTPQVSDTAPVDPLIDDLWVNTSLEAPTLFVYDGALGWVASGVGGGSTFGGVAYDNVIAGTNITFNDNGDGTVTLNVSSGTATISDGDYGDVVVSGSGAVWTVVDPPAADVFVVATPSNYSAAGPDVEAHLKGIDQTLGLSGGGFSDLILPERNSVGFDSLILEARA